MFPAPPEAVTTVFTEMPAKFRRSGRSDWADHNKHGASLHSFLEGPCFVDEGAVVKAGAKIGPYSVIGHACHIEEHAVVHRSILWPNTRVSQDATVERSILGRHCHIGRNAAVDDGVFGDRTVFTDFSRT